MLDATPKETASLLRVVLEPWSIEVVRERVEGDSASYFQAKEDFDSLNDAVLLRIHNSATGTALRRFPSRSVAAQKTWVAVRELFQSQSAQARIAADSSRVEEAPQAGSPDTSREATLRAEIASLRQLLGEKTAALRLLQGKTGAAGETATVVQILALLRRTDGSTKEALVKDTSAKKGYVDALLNRILPGKGYVVRSRITDGQRTKTYFLDD